MLNRLSLAACLGLAICAGASVAAARAQSGYSAFQPIPNRGSQTCVSETWGGALNSCASAQTMVFDLAADSTGTKFITAAMVGAPAVGFSCRAVAHHVNAQNATFGAFVAFSNTSAIEAKTFAVNANLGENLRLHCTSVPVNKGILNLNWNP